jgi:DNA-directed RNA polymerase specialized sigma subunit
MVEEEVVGAGTGAEGEAAAAAIEDNIIALSDEEKRMKVLQLYYKEKKPMGKIAQELRMSLTTICNIIM